MARASFRSTIPDRYQPCLHCRLAEGCHDASVLHAEITELGYRGSLRTVLPLPSSPCATGQPPRLSTAKLRWL